MSSDLTKRVIKSGDPNAGSIWKRAGRILINGVEQGRICPDCLQEDWSRRSTFIQHHGQRPDGSRKCQKMSHPSTPTGAAAGSASLAVPAAAAAAAPAAQADEPPLGIALEQDGDGIGQSEDGECVFQSRQSCTHVDTRAHLRVARWPVMHMGIAADYVLQQLAALGAPMSLSARQRSLEQCSRQEPRHVTGVVCSHCCTHAQVVRHGTTTSGTTVQRMLNGWLTPRRWTREHHTLWATPRLQLQRSPTPATATPASCRTSSLLTLLQPSWG